MKQIPPQAKCVFKGVIFNVYQWEQTLYDGSSATFECLSRADSTEVITVVDDKIVVLEQEQPTKSLFVSLPGGQLDRGEEPLAGAERELLEETGYSAKDWFFWKQEQPASKTVWTVHTFIARQAVKISEPHLDAGEKIITKLVTFDEFLLLSENDRFIHLSLKPILMKARFDREARAELYQLLFGKAEN